MDLGQRTTRRPKVDDRNLPFSRRPLPLFSFFSEGGYLNELNTGPSQLQAYNFCYALEIAFLGSHNVRRFGDSRIHRHLCER
jgi:hypothetical protein